MSPTVRALCRRRHNERMLCEWPLTGRTAEVERIREILTGNSGGLMLVGAAGTGKTRLALECLRLAEEEGMYGARVVATRAAAGIPLGALAPVLPVSHHGESGGVDNRAGLLRRCAASLVELAGDRRFVLVVDDAHLLDDTSATLIHQLVVTGAAFVATTSRTAEPAPDAILALWKDEGVERLEVGGLRSAAIEELLRAVLGGAVDAGAVRALTTGSQGNVLFLRELTMAALQDHVLHDDAGVWRLTGRVPLSNRLVEIVEHRVANVSEGERSLLEVLSYGEPLGHAELISHGGERLAERLDRIGLLSSHSNGRRLETRLSHPLYAQALQDRIPAVRSRTIARSLAEAVEATGLRRREDVLRVATWRLEVGGAQPDVMFKAATMARWRYDFPLAERLARAAVVAGAGFDAALLAAQLTSLQGRGLEAEQELAALAERASEDRERALVAIPRLDNLAYRMGRADDALRLAEDAEGAVSDARWRDEITAKRASVLAGRDGARAALEVAEPMLERGRGRALAWATIVVEYSCGRMGRLDAVSRAASYGKPIHEQLSEPLDWYPWLHDFFRCEALVFAGSLLDAEAVARCHYEAGVEEGSTEAQAFFALALARTLTDQGLLQTAAAHAREGAALFLEQGQLVLAREGLSRLAMALALAGEAGGAGQALADLDALALPPSMNYGTDLLRARAWTAVAADDLRAGRCLLEEAAKIGRETGDHVGEAAALHGLARLGLPKQVAPRLKDLAGEIEGVLVPLRVAHCEALANSDPEALEQVSSEFTSVGACLLAAEAAADAAVAWQRAGNARRAAGAARQADELMHDRCEHPRTPALQATTSRSSLTRAERDTALLAAAGYSNKDIAEKVHLSVRTIEAQLQRVYGKLGICSRNDLRDALKSTENRRADRRLHPRGSREAASPPPTNTDPFTVP